MLKSGYFYRISLKKNIATPPLSNPGYSSATPMNFAEFGGPAHGCHLSLRNSSQPLTNMSLNTPLY